MKKVRKQKRLVFELTLSGLSVALILIFLVGAQFSPVMKLTFFALAGISLLLPCIAESFWGLLMSFIAGGSLSLIFSPVNIVPFALFFGLQVILMYICKRWLKNKWYISLPLKVAILEIGIFGIFKLYGISYIENLFDNFGWNYNYWFVMLITLPFVVAYDYLIQYGYKVLSLRLNKVVCKYTDKVKAVDKNQNSEINTTQDGLNSANQNEPPTDNNSNDSDDDPFGNF